MSTSNKTNVSGFAFAARLKEAFGSSNAAEIARRIGKPHPTVSNYLKGRLPAAEELIRITVETNVSLTWLLTGRGPKWINVPTEMGEESLLCFTEEEREFIVGLAIEAGQSFDAQVRELVLEVLPSYGLIPGKQTTEQKLEKENTQPMQDEALSPKARAEVRKLIIKVIAALLLSPTNKDDTNNLLADLQRELSAKLFEG